MTKESVNVDVSNEDRPVRTHFKSIRKVMLAMIGAASLAREEVEKKVDQFAERGEATEKDARQLVREMVDRKEKLVEEKYASRTQKVAIEQKEIDQLKEQIEALKAEIEALKKHQEA